MNVRSTHPERGVVRSTGFTLMELLVAVTIIAILASVVLGAMISARRLASESKTKSMIARLDEIITLRYEAYRTRRIPISAAGTDLRNIARVRLDALRDLMRMGMPDRWYDVYEDGDVGNQVPLRNMSTSGQQVKSFIFC